MTLDEAIKHAEEVAEENQERANSTILMERNGTKFLYDGEEYRKCCKCAEEHRQLAEWLKDYKRLLEQETVSRESYEHEYLLRKEFEIKIAKLEQQEPKTGHWISKSYSIPIKTKELSTVANGYYGAVSTSCKYRYTYICSICGGNEYFEKYSYCPNCGARMVEPQESENKE